MARVSITWACNHKEDRDVPEPCVMLSRYARVDGVDLYSVRTSTIECQECEPRMYAKRNILYANLSK